jgi:hypothetical protein
MTKIKNNSDLFKLGKMYKNIEQDVAWPFYVLRNECFAVVKGRHLDPSNTFVAIEYVDNLGSVWDSYKILFEDGNLYYITFSKIRGIDYGKSFSIVI